jgi:hypothetical protein
MQRLTTYTCVGLLPTTVCRALMGLFSDCSAAHIKPFVDLLFTNTAEEACLRAGRGGGHQKHAWGGSHNGCTFREFAL